MKAISNPMDLHPWFWTDKEKAQGFADPIEPVFSNALEEREYEKRLDEKAKQIQIKALTQGYHPQTGRPAKAFKWADSDNCLPRAKRP